MAGQSLCVPFMRVQYVKPGFHIGPRHNERKHQHKQFPESIADYGNTLSGSIVDSSNQRKTPSAKLNLVQLCRLLAHTNTYSWRTNDECPARWSAMDLPFFEKRTSDCQMERNVFTIKIKQSCVSRILPLAKRPTPQKNNSNKQKTKNKTINK